MKFYLRYGDDFIVLENDPEKLDLLRTRAIAFLKDELKLQVNPKNDKIIKTCHGLRFLGVKLWPSGRTLNKRNLSRARTRLNARNISSYSGLIKKHSNAKQIKQFDWLASEKIMNEI